MRLREFNETKRSKVIILLNFHWTGPSFEKYTHLTFGSKGFLQNTSFCEITTSI